MLSSNLDNKLQELTKIHEQTILAFEAAVLDSATRSEYKRQIDQYESMYQSLQQMKTLSKDAKTISSLEERQSELLQQRIAFETYCLELWGR